MPGMYASQFRLFCTRNMGIRKYGFHGTSHMYVARRAAAMLGKPEKDVKVITCHLGNGSSITAVKVGNPLRLAWALPR